MLPPGLDLPAALMTSQQLSSPEQDEARKASSYGKEAPKTLPFLEELLATAGWWQREIHIQVATCMLSRLHIYESNGNTN